MLQHLRVEAHGAKKNLNVFDVAVVVWNTKQRKTAYIMISCEPFDSG